MQTKQAGYLACKEMEFIDMDAILSFKQAALALQQDERYFALQETKQKSDEDKVLQDKIGEFNLLRLELNNEMTKDERDNMRIGQLNFQASSLYNEIMTNESMVAYNQAKADIEKMIEHVNAILNTAIEGGDPLTVEEPVAAAGCGCSSGGCSGCAGCG